MITLAWILGSIVAYLATGWRIATWDLPALWCRQRAKHPGWTEEKLRSEVAPLSTCIGLFWPFCLPYLVMSRETVKRDPKRLEQEIAQLKRESAELDRQLAEARRTDWPFDG